MSTLHPPPGSHPDPALGPLPDNTFLLGGSLAGISVSTDPKRILESCPNLFQLLEVVNERGFDGPVEKIVISQESFGRCLNVLLPGSYTSISKIDLKSLDNLSIKPTGVYGDPLEIIMFLQKVGYLHSNLAAVLFQTIKSSSASAALSSGLYLALDPKHGAWSSKSAYIIYWPEDTTWDDQAAWPSVRHNRVTFMHYLSKLVDQTLALVSSSQAHGFIWGAGAHKNEHADDQQTKDDGGRFLDFEVAHTVKQEDAVGSPGFKVMIEPNLLPPANERAESRVQLVPGEQTPGLLVIRHEKEQNEEKAFESNISPMVLRKMIESKDCPIQLGNLTPSDLDVLASHGLRSQHRQIFDKYDGRLRELNAERSKIEIADKEHIEDQINRDRPKIREEILHSVRIQYDKLYPSLQIGLDAPHEPEETALLHRCYSDLNKVAEEIRKKHKLESVQDREFQLLKGRWPTIKEYLEKNPRLSDADHADFINDVYNSVSQPLTSGLSGFRQPIWNPWNHIPLSHSSGSAASSRNTSTQVTDPEFVPQLGAMEQDFPSLAIIMRQVNNALGRNLDTLEKRVVADQLDRITSMQKQRQINAATVNSDYKHREETRLAFEGVIQELREAMASNARQVRRVDWIRLTHGAQDDNSFCAGSSDSYAAQYYWGGSVTSLRPAQNRHSIYPLELTEQGSQLCRADKAHIAQPKVDTRHKFEFNLPTGRAVEFMQLVRDKCLVIVSERGRTRVFIEENVTINHAVNVTHGKVSLSHESLGGPQCKFAFDQATRLLSIVHGHKDDLKLSIYIFDELFSNLRSRGSPISLRGWFDNRPIDLSQTCFVPGLEEICFMEASGRARIFSLITQQFRNVSLQIDEPVIDAFSSPDGSCLFVVVPMDQSTSHRLLAFHWASFGNNNKGTESACLHPCTGYRVATRFEGQGLVHVISFNITSKAVTSTIMKISQRESKFYLRSGFTGAINNSLFDCHLEVWTQFPIVPAVIRSTPVAMARQTKALTFVSPVLLWGVEEYFAQMLSTCESTTRKPMGTALTAMNIKSISKPDRGIPNATSEYKLGSFIVELLCLIPLRLAVTRENLFIPLNNGVWDLEYERMLLRPDGPTIANILSLGWYESLLQSYMATKPIRVIGSMGEQTEGKNYYLNHFADTSFAGPVIPANEGVWLSCTPTEGCLLVSLDFKVSHSTEQSAQEGALLVLFGAAISNLLLFHDGVEASWSADNPFSSFQFSSMILEPGDNLELFNSTLAIVINDVTDADLGETSQKFSLELHRIVERERGQNFITRLHRGRISVIPWPVVNSPGYYALFDHLYQRMDRQPSTHDSGGIFLHNLKTLITMFKINDWGSMDQNAATYRAQQLVEMLPDALSFGRHEGSPLTNIDTDTELDTPDFMPVLFVPEFATQNATESEALAEQALGELVRSCGQIDHTRHHTRDLSYVEALQESIYKTIDQRLSLVQKWVGVNIERFPSRNLGIRSLATKLHAASLGMSNAARLCLSGCSSCQLLCLRVYRHSGEHSCGTSHQCVLDCEVADEHTQRVLCGLLAGHGGRHMCDVKTHSCGMLCHLWEKSGCAQSCTKPLDHEREHLCSGREHNCGKPCDLRYVRHGGGGGIFDCPGTCIIRWDEPHQRHACDTRLCPIECTLCRRSCCSTEHFHGLFPSAVHLCGQEHSCTRLCEANGVCQIETCPSEIQDQFSNQIQSFIYTRYVQVERRISCVIPIPPGALTHEGAHMHDAMDKFHFCDVRCPNCEYFCRLPFGHGQQLHETGHGPMINNQWSLQVDNGDAAPVYELKGRKFGSFGEGSPVLCNLACAGRGRHAHIDYCRDPENCSSTNCEHIAERMHPDPGRAKDWISHATFWERSGFKDPYSYEDQNEFSKCDVRCAGTEHKASATSPAHPSYCTLPLFHAPGSSEANPTLGYISEEGHTFDCQNPAEMN